MKDLEKSPVSSEGTDISPIEQGEVLDHSTKIGEKSDIGYDLFQESHQYDEAQLERDAVKVRRKLDFMVLPMVYTTQAPL